MLCDPVTGHGDRASVTLPRVVRALRGLAVHQVSLGTSHSSCLTRDRHVYTWGYARQDSAEDFFRLGALLFTAMGWILIPVYCFALP